MSMPIFLRFLSLLLLTIFLRLYNVHSTSPPIQKPAFYQRHRVNKKLTPVVPIPNVSVTPSTLLSTSENTTVVIPEWKQRLPPPLNNKTKTLKRIMIPGSQEGRGVDIYLLGTAHVSIDSSRDVRLLLEAIHPDVIFLELCDQRVPLLVASSSEPPANHTSQSPTKPSLWQQLRQTPNRNSLYAMAATMLTHMQQDYADSLGVELGGEFRVAHDYWDRERQQSQLHLVLGDRPLYITLTRAWESLGVWGKTKLLFGLLLSTFQKPNPEELKAWMQSILQDDSGDLLSKSIAELAEHFPTLEQVIIKERDAYMACKLYQLSRQLMMQQQQQQQSRDISQPEGTRRPTIVAIVGAGHVEGICTWLTVGNGQTAEQILSKLIEMKKPIASDQAQVLVEEVMEVNYELLREILNDL